MRETLLTFVLIFLAALPGRTTFILILLAASVRPWRILMSAIPAFTIQCALAVTLGQTLKKLPHLYIQSAAGILFLYFAGKFWIDSKRPDPLTNNEAQKSMISIFLLFFMAEFGDVSQLAVASRAIQSESLLSTFVGSAGAMSTLAVFSVFTGRFLGTKITPTALQKMAAFIFLLLGSYLLMNALHGSSP